MSTLETLDERYAESRRPGDTIVIDGITWVWDSFGPGTDDGNVVIKPPAIGTSNRRSTYVGRPAKVGRRRIEWWPPRECVGITSRGRKCGRIHCRAHDLQPWQLDPRISPWTK